MSEPALRVFVPSVFALFFAVGFGRWIGGAVEAYPFGAWAMFQRQPRAYHVYDLRVSRFDGRELDPPVLASEAPPELGLALDAHRQLVLNAYVQHTRRGRPERGEPYREFIAREIVGPDARYEILHIRARSRGDERDQETTVAYGPFETSAEQPPRVAGARFDFFGGKKFQPRKSDGHRRHKRRNLPD